MKLALDTNILAYVEGLNGQAHQDRANSFVQRIPRQRIVIPGQVVAELFNLLVRKGGLPRREAQGLAGRWRQSYELAPTSTQVLRKAMNLATAHGFQIFDAIILAAANETACEYLLSEDMHDGFFWNGVTIVNPFSPDRRELIERLITAG